jgi:hypothetical protein
VLIERWDRVLNGVVIHLRYGSPGTGKHNARRQRCGRSSRRDGKAQEQTAENAASASAAALSAADRKSRFRARGEHGYGALVVGRLRGTSADACRVIFVFFRLHLETFPFNRMG